MLSLFVLTNSFSAIPGQVKPATHSEAPPQSATHFDTSDSNASFYDTWGTKIKKAQAQEHLTFELKFPSPKGKAIAGAQTDIVVEGKPSVEEGTKSKAAYIFFSEGIRIWQSYIEVGENPPPTELEDFGVGSEQYKEKEKYWINIDINGATGMGYEPRTQETFSGPYRAPGAVTWYDETRRIEYVVYGNGQMPLAQLSEIARSIDF